MKNILFAGLVTITLLVMTAGRSMAYSNWHDDKYWYDSQGHHHKFVTHDHHHGYWDTQNGARIFINID